MTDPRKPKCIGLVRLETSGLEATHHVSEIRRHAERLGYVYLYTVRPPESHGDPVGYALNIAVAVRVAALGVYDLSTVDNSPSRVCDVCDLETVSPPQTWAAVLPGSAAPAHEHPDHPLTVAEAEHIMGEHMTCRAAECARKFSAYNFLVRAGKIVPPIDTPRERAAARGISFPSRSTEVPVSDDSGIRTPRADQLARTERSWIAGRVG